MGHNAVAQPEHDVVERARTTVREFNPTEPAGGQGIVDDSSGEVVLRHVAPLRAPLALSGRDARALSAARFRSGAGRHWI